MLTRYAYALGRTLSNFPRLFGINKKQSEPAFLNPNLANLLNNQPNCDIHTETAIKEFWKHLFCHNWINVQTTTSPKPLCWYTNADGYAVSQEATVLTRKWKAGLREGDIDLGRAIAKEMDQEVLQTIEKHCSEKRHFACHRDGLPGFLEWLNEKPTWVAHSPKTTFTKPKSVKNVFLFPELKDNLLIMGRVGDKPCQRGMTFRPYILFTPTPVTLDPNSFTHIVGLLGRYALVVHDTNYSLTVTLHD